MLRQAQFFVPGKPSDDYRRLHRHGGRGAEEFYRERWRHDREVRSTHGVNCTGSCSWKVYVKDGIITWETQQTDYPSVGPDSPEYEPPTEVAQHYVETFDLRRRCALYLSYYRYGDTRKRGMAMLSFKAAYRAAGFEPSEDELPDYLPLVLDFAALGPRGEKLLRGHRADLELLRRALTDAGTPYADVVAAVCARLPKLGRRDLALVRRAWEQGPPEEEVGLEPFAPPEYLDGSGTGARR
ncbi:nitrate reductase molybdenum cofactor assembly chaperone [Actinomadura opuntiae]|uniref:nitrate reductase molybdenum cofactor assembly chaperone n=1 Tax=Actinomadura sp. OS1-43 TaxID=604315 RepID=UPI004062A2B8